jgi:hypothetical protein
VPCLYRSDFQITIPTFLAGESSWLYYHQKRFTLRVQLRLFLDPSLSVTGAPRGWVFGAILVCLVVSWSGNAQTNSTATKLDEFWDLTTDDAQAHLDRFAQELAKDSKVRGVIVAYRPQDTFVGSHLRLLFGYHDYLVNSRGIASEQLRVVDSGARDKPKIELWLVPDGAGFSAYAPSATVARPTRFDQVYAGDGCWPEYTIELYEPADAVRFFADALNEHSDLKGIIIVHPSWRMAVREGIKLLNDSRARLETKYRIASTRLRTEVGASRYCHEIGFWLVPSTFVVPAGPSIEEVLFSQLMTEAEINQFTVRRVEFVGNTWTRDQTLRRRIPRLQEGETFRRDMLQTSLASLSGLHSIKTVRLKDIDVYLNRHENTIDLTISVRPRSKRRR